MRFLLRRLGFFVLTLWAALTINFFIPHLMPGSPLQALRDRTHNKLSPQALQELLASFGFKPNQNIFEQYLDYLRDMLTGHWGVSIHDLTNGTQRLLTSTTESSQWPVWTADGKRIIYRLTREGRRNLFWRNADGSGEEERLTTSDHMQTANSVSPDGRWLAFQEIDPVSADDIWILPLDKKGAARPFVKTTADEVGAAFSPDGAWLAYYSSESGQYQVYVQAFPGPGARTVVSPRGGRMPRWSTDGRELFYLEGNQVIAVTVTPGSSMSTGSPRVIATKSDADAPGGYDVARDGRFLMVRPVQSEDVFRQINLVINWFDELKRLAAK